MHTTIYCRIIRHTHIFQPGNVLEIRSRVPEKCPGDAEAGYFIPDTGYGLPGALPIDAVQLCDSPEKQDAYYGQCVLTQVTNYQKSATTAYNGAETIGMVKPEQVRAVHYRDFQQLCFHMPKYAYDAGTFRLLNRASGKTLEECAVRDRLNGTTMILINTLPYPPGFYEIEAGWPGGWTHRIRFIKFTEGFPNQSYENPPTHLARAILGEDLHLLPAPKAEPPADRHVNHRQNVPPGYTSPPGNLQMVQNDREHRVYDSNGIEIDPAFDHQRLKNEILGRLLRTVRYAQHGRGGSIYYMEGDIEIEFEWEFGGGNAVVILLIPETRFWEAQTGTPLSRRDEILRYVCEQVIRDQAPGCSYEIYGSSISIVR